MSLEELTKMKDIQRDELRVELQSKVDALRKTVSILPVYSVCCYHDNLHAKYIYFVNT